jgi:D-serine deaminase-like pyridoxal phosphate-dependent protein
VNTPRHRAYTVPIMDTDIRPLPITALETPCLLLDRAVLRRNLAVMAARMKRHQVDLRPHLKTAKSANVAKLATEGQAGGITVSTLAEARYFADHGFTDILYAVGIVPPRLEQVAALRQRGIDLKIITDSPDVARAIASHNGSFAVLIEIDSGAHRAGLDPASSLLLEVAGTLHDAPNATLLGVMTHAGHSYHCHSTQEVAAIAETERLAAVTAAERLRQAGIPCPVVSVGSTPTAVHARSLAGVTEMRPGVYMFNDLDQLALGSCGPGDLALSVLASVIGQYPHRNQVLIDAGALALSKDISATEFMPEAGFGTIADYDGLSVVEVNQEHGFLGSTAKLPLEHLSIGAKLRIWPNHACITAAAYDRYHVIDSDLDGGASVVEIWDRTNGW